MLFARLDEGKTLEQIHAENASPAPAAVKKPEPMEEITIEDFMKTELRAAKVTGCEPVEKSDKLLKLTLDLGYESRQVVSGIAKFYKPADLIGKKVAVVANLKPAKLRGVESQGMILAAGEDDVKVLFLDESVPCGARIR
jgi:methionyl-tRNA synthetase